MVVNNGAFLPTPRSGQAVRTIAHYPQTSLLQSGWVTGESWLRGASSALDVSLGRGRVILFAFRPQHRGQTVGTFKLLLNAVYYAAMSTTSTSAMPTQQD
jgi:hypothetical protein